MKDTNLIKDVDSHHNDNCNKKCIQFEKSDEEKAASKKLFGTKNNFALSRRQMQLKRFEKLQEGGGSEK